MALASAPVFKATWTCQPSPSLPSLSPSSSSSSTSHCCCKLQPWLALKMRAGGPPGAAQRCCGARLSARLVVIARSDPTEWWGPQIQGQRCGLRFGRRYPPFSETRDSCGRRRTGAHRWSAGMTRGAGGLAGKEQVWAAAEGRRFLSSSGSALGVGLGSETAKNALLWGVLSASTAASDSERSHPVTPLDQLPSVIWPGLSGGPHHGRAELRLELAAPRGAKLEGECGRGLTSIGLWVGEKRGDRGSGVGGGVTPTMTGTLRTPVASRTRFAPGARTWFGPWTSATPGGAKFTSAVSRTGGGGMVSGCDRPTQTASRGISARADNIIIRVSCGGDGPVGEAEGDEEGSNSGMGERGLGERRRVSVREDGRQTEALAAAEANPPLKDNAPPPLLKLSKHQAQKEEEEEEEEGRKEEQEGEQEEKEGKDKQVYAEVRPNGRKFFEVMATSIHKVSHGCIVGLLCTEKNKGLSKSCREFPLFLNKLSFDCIREALDRGGLPHALEELDRLCDHDLQSIYVTGFDDEKTGGEFAVLDEKTTRVTIVPSTFPQAIAVALRYQQPFFLEREAVFSANTDFVDRMLINPMAREHEGDLQMLASLSRRMRELGERGVSIRRDLMEAVRAEEYERAARTKVQIQELDREMDAKLPGLLAELKHLYLERMGIFFKL